MIDLHVHSKYSDGTDDIIDILKKAESKKIKILSITDHENCKIYEKMKDIDISDYYTGKIINGIELKTVIKGVPIELLGYGVDVAYINKKVSEIYAERSENDFIIMKRLHKNCLKLGVRIDDDVIENYDNSYRYATTYLHENITSYEENRKFILSDKAWGDSTSFYRKYMSNPNSHFYISNHDLLPDCNKIINLIREAGGLVFVPHIYIYGENSNMILEELTENYNIDGIECYYSHFTEEQSKYLVNYCNERCLYISGGSDYHGTRKREIKLGIGLGNLNVPDNIIDSWIDKVINKKKNNNTN
ncbi:MAG: PHP domain-containing protein [Clostridia bacterium]|nr:PHP domain-containing protein [Clostridia bacterium]MDD4386816.1 PHP domain-containing protein [Clostridia bacterium]